MQAQPHCTHVASKLVSTVVVSMGRPKRFKISQSIKYCKCFTNTTLDSVLCMGRSETTSMPCQVALLALIVTSKHVPFQASGSNPCFPLLRTSCCTGVGRSQSSWHKARYLGKNTVVFVWMHFSGPVLDLLDNHSAKVPATVGSFCGASSTAWIISGQMPNSSKALMA